MTDSPFISSAEATAQSQSVRQAGLVRPITGRRADNLVRFLKQSFVRAQSEESPSSPPRVHGYGLTAVTPFRAFREIDANGHLNLIDVIAAEPVDGVMALEVSTLRTDFIFSGDFPGQIRDSGLLFAGRLSGTGSLGQLPPIGTQIRFFLGSQQAADSELVSLTSWAATSIGKGLSYVYSRWVPLAGAFDGDPEIKVYARLGKPTDPRDIEFTTVGGVVSPLVAWTNITGIGTDSFPIPDGNDRLLVVAVTTEDGSFPTIDGCSFGDQSLAPLGTQIAEPSSGLTRSALFYLLESEIDAATGDVIHQMFSSAPASVTTMAAVYENVNQVSPFVDVQTTTGDAGNAAALTLDTAANGYLFGHYMSGTVSDITWPTGQAAVAEFDAASTTAGIGEATTDGNSQSIQGQASSADRSLFQAVSLRPDTETITNAGSFNYENLPKKFSVNPYVQVFDLLIKPKDLGGKGIEVDLIDVETFQAMASWAEGLVDVQATTKTAIFTEDSNKSLGTPPSSTNHLLEFNQQVVPFNYGDVVTLSGSVPAAVTPGIEYFVIPVRPAINEFQLPAVALALTFADSMAGNSIPLGNFTADFNVTKVKETRFMTGFSYAAGETDSALAEALKTCGAALYLNDGRIAITRQNFPTTAEVVTEDDLTGPVALSNRLPSDERATEVAGSFSGLLNLFQKKDYPTRSGGGIYQAADLGIRRQQRLDLPYVGKVGPAQRLATVALRRVRQERVLTFPGTLPLMRLTPGKLFYFDKPSLGLGDETTFEVRDHTIFAEIANARPRFGVEVVARQLEPETFDTGISDAAVIESAKIPGLQSPFDVPLPGRPEITEELFQTRAGAGVRARAVMSWAPSTGAFVKEYRASYRLSTATAYIFLPATPDTSITINDLAPGTYDFRVEAVNSVGAVSDPSTTLGTVIKGLGAPPAAPQNFSGEVFGAASLLLSWTKSPELDVTEGGLIQILHDTNTAGGNAANARVIATDVGGKTISQVPFSGGVYYARFQDTSGQWSDFAEWSTEDRRPVPFGQVIVSGAFQTNDTVEDQVTLAESPTFPSTNVNNTMVFDTDHVELAAASTWDDVTNVDDVANVDEVGADGEVQPTGVWFFNQGIDLSAVTRVLLEAVITIEIVDQTDSIDNITDIDSVINIDAVGAAASQPGVANAWIEVRFSRDAAASNTFGPWQKLTTQFFNHRSYEFRIVAETTQPTVNVRVSQAEIIARERPPSAA